MIITKFVLKTYLRMSQEDINDILEFITKRSSKYLINDWEEKYSIKEQELLSKDEVVYVEQYNK